MTGGRIKRVEKHIGNETFLLTYGDGVADVNIKELVGFHKAHKKLCTVTAVQPSGRFGAINLSDDHKVSSFTEKPKGDRTWVNGGFFVCEPGVMNYIKEGDETLWEKEPMEKLTGEGQMMAYKHEGFWKPMDTLRDKTELDKDWNNGQAKWKIW
jgi:glucose-1-phosphate cytidylyltransferase